VTRTASRRTYNTSSWVSGSSRQSELLPELELELLEEEDEHLLDFPPQARTLKERMMAPTTVAVNLNTRFFLLFLIGSG
jgi:hypothetical protein